MKLRLALRRGRGDFSPARVVALMLATVVLTLGAVMLYVNIGKRIDYQRYHHAPPGFRYEFPVQAPVGHPTLRT